MPAPGTMAHSVQSVTLALTLPISCHICLGKVRQPVICVNNHVFCSVCIDLWLKNNNQCPVCRVPITPENPCKDIIGGASENEDTLSHSVRKHLRKTRFELLHKEYEDEIESLIKETEELRRSNLQLEERLSRVPDPVTVSACNCDNKQQIQDKNSLCDQLIEGWKERLEMMNAANKKVTQDMDKLKEENKRLKNENIECARENLRLKNEVELRSPQKFGRFTVAALQAKVEQYEREMSRLRKALERSDQYIEELEEQIVQQKRPSEDKKIEESQRGSTDGMGDYGSRPSTSDICKNNYAAAFRPKDYQEDVISSKDPKPFGTVSKLENCLASASWTEESPRKGIARTSQGFLSPSSSIPFSSLHLNTPDGKESHTQIKKPLTYLRKLTFDELPKNREVALLTQSRTSQQMDKARENMATSDEDLEQPETSSSNSHDDYGNASMLHMPTNVLVARPATDVGSQENSSSNSNSIQTGHEARPQSTFFTFPELRNSPSAKRRLLISRSDSPSKSSKH